jgi:phosphopantetheinyl transferase
MEPLQIIALDTLDTRTLRAGCSLALLLPLPVLPRASQLERRAAVHAALRSILGLLTSRAPESLRFAKTSQGKPYLEGDDAVHFNISHAQSHSLLAFSRVSSIGCDIEDRFADDDVIKLSPLVLHPAEAQALGRLPVQERQSAFRRNWARKEAVLKALGAGFLEDPRSLLTGFDDASAASALHGGAQYTIHGRRIDGACEAAVAGAEPACEWRLLASRP